MDKINLGVRTNDHYEIFLDSGPWVELIPQVWEALRNDDWSRFKDNPLDLISKNSSFDKLISIYTGLTHAVTFGHLIAKPGVVINAHYARKEIGLTPIFSNKFERFWGELIPALGIWALEYGDNRIIDSESQSMIHDHEYLKLSKKSKSYSNICDDGGWDKMHLSNHSSVPIQREFLPYKIETQNNITSLNFKNYSSWATYLLNQEVKDQKIFAIHIDTLGLIGHFKVINPNLISISERELTPSNVVFLNDKSVEKELNKSIKETKKRRIPDVNDDFQTILSFFGSFNGYEFAKQNNFDLGIKVSEWSSYYQINDRIQPDLTIEEIRAWQFFVARSIRFGSMESYDLYGDGPSSFAAKNWSDKHWVSGWKIWVDLLERCRELSNSNEL